MTHTHMYCGPLWLLSGSDSFNGNTQSMSHHARMVNYIRGGNAAIKSSSITWLHEVKWKAGRLLVCQFFMYFEGIRIQLIAEILRWWSHIIQGEIICEARVENQRTWYPVVWINPNDGVIHSSVPTSFSWRSSRQSQWADWDLHHCYRLFMCVALKSSRSFLCCSAGLLEPDLHRAACQIRASYKRNPQPNPLTR